MTRHNRKSERHYALNLARKARRRGEPAEAARWLRLVALHQQNDARSDAATRRKREEDAEWMRQEAEYLKNEEAKRRLGIN